MSEEPTKELEALISGWCDRREFGALAYTLPAWIGNNGLTDGWAELRDALRHTYAMCNHLPPDERDTLKRIYVAIDVALRNR
jgi:hypothetical protein